MNETPRERRERLRELARRGDAAFVRGLPPVPSEPDITAVSLLLARKLGDADNVRRASETARLAHRLFESSLAANPSPDKLACRMGCAHCCHHYVSVSAPEALLLARAIRATEKEQPTLAMPHLATRLAAAAGRTPAERQGKRIPCPLLIDGACSVYGERPMVCRQTVARDIDLCRREADGEDVRVPAVPRYLAHASNSGVAMMAAMLANSRTPFFYELAGAVRIALELPDAEKRWLAGEDIFADALRSPVPMPVLKTAENIARSLGRVM